jgi:HEAT repeat protein
MTGDASEEIRELLQMLDSDNLDDRMTAIQVLGDVGDEDTLHALRERMAVVNKELQALVIAVGKTKRRLGIK